MSRTKLIAAVVLVAGGLAAGALARLGAEPPTANPPAPPSLPLPQKLTVDTGRPAAWEFKYYAPALPMTLGVIEQRSAAYAADGWEFVGVVALNPVTPDDRKRVEFATAEVLKQALVGGAEVLVFKRPARVAAKPRVDYDAAVLGLTLVEPPDATAVADVLRLALTPSPPASKVGEMRALEARIAAMQKQLADLRAASTKTAVLTAKDLPGADLGAVMTVLVNVADLRYGADGRKQRLSFSHGNVGKTTPDGGVVFPGVDGLTITGDPDAVDWVVEVAGKLKKN